MTIKRRGLLVMTLAALMLTLLMAGVLWQWVQYASLDRVENTLHSWTPWLMFIRWSVIAVIAGLWPFLVNALQQRARIQPEQAEAMHNARWRVVGWMVVIELVLGQNLIGKVTDGLV